MEKTQEASIAVPLGLTAAAGLVAAVLTVLSLGLLLPLAAAVILLSLVLNGLWLVMNRRTAGARLAAAALIFGSLALGGLLLLSFLMGFA